MSRKNVIYYEFTDKYRSQIIDHLYKNYNWNPVLVSGVDVQPIEKWFHENYNDCVIKSGMALRQGQFDYRKIGTPVPIDEKILNSLAKYELNFMGLSPDTTGWNFSFYERKRYYYDVLKFWNTVIHNLAPDVFVSFTWPHTQNCYAIYLLCKHYYNIDVIFLDPVPLFDSHYHLIGSSLETLYKPFIKYYESDEKLIPSATVCEYLTNVRSKSGKPPDYIIAAYSEFDKNIFENFKYFGKRIIVNILKGVMFEKATIDWKNNQKPKGTPASIMSNFEHVLFSIKLIIKNKKLRKYYNPYCVEPNYDKKYLYFAAPYQPEAVTATNAGVYEDVFLVLDILSSVVPKDWVIYYKEHPAIFVSGLRGSLRRDKYFYEKVRLYSNVVLIRSQIDTFTLIDNSQAVATMAGTVAWEASLRGKPSLSFGSTWYQGCKSIFTIKTLQDALGAMRMIGSGYIPDQADLERYAASIEKVAVKKMVHRNFNKEIEKSEDSGYELLRIAEAIKIAYENNYSASGKN